MIYNIIADKKNEWLQSENCAVKDLFKYIKNTNQLRDAQIEAIETYLFLKIACKNQPLWALFSQGIFTSEIDLDSLNINSVSRHYLKSNSNALALYQFAIQNKIIGLQEAILSNPNSINYDSIIKAMFYNVGYADYLMSLPMGAGKTYLMSAFIYLDLYFAQNEPDNKLFAHNFLVLAPSGLKSSIIPSLKSIENFDPAWIIPEPTASNLKRQLKFEVLDEQKSAKKSNKTRNPNAQKVNNCLPNPFAYVFVVNAEKVILDSFDFTGQLELDLTQINDTDNDLKAKLAEIPNLSIMIDEVHHAATEDKKLRQAINYWQNKGNITTVLGFSGTPYLYKPEQIAINGYKFKFTLITNTVYYYPLIHGIANFLKIPKIKIAENSNKLETIQQGIIDFNNTYAKTIYTNGTIAKIAIYCSSIEMLETEVYPLLIQELKIPEHEILKFHGGNKEYKLPNENELEFRSLDLAVSNKRYILLVQIGKEGWDCKSLTGVILSQAGDCPKNMVLQTTCRCLRQVSKDQAETAVVWLNRENATILNEQLKKEQNSSIEQLNNAKAIGKDLIIRHSRMEFLQIPPIDFYQMKINYQSINEEQTTNTNHKLQKLLNEINNYFNHSLITETEITDLDNGSTSYIQQSMGNAGTYKQWLFDISRSSFAKITLHELEQFNDILQQIFEQISFVQDNITYLNQQYDIDGIMAQIRLTYSVRRELHTSHEIIPQQAELLITDKLTAIEANNNLRPTQKHVEKILELDKTNASLDIDITQLRKKHDEAKKLLEAQGMGNFMQPWDSFYQEHNLAPEIKIKNQTYHYLPYNFGGSGASNFEKDMLQATINLKAFKDNKLEIYYNGERGLTEFVIDCFYKSGKQWKSAGKYTTDFLIIKRNDDKSIHKILLLETKGAIYANDQTFKHKKKYIETEFLKLNQEKFNYKRFDFLYLETTNDNPQATINKKLSEFFRDSPSHNNFRI